MQNAEILRKLTIKSAGLTVEAIKESLISGKDAEGKAIYHTSRDLLKIAGIVSSAKPGSTDKGEYLKLIGQFTAVNLVTGEMFNASQCILPDFVTAPLGEALKQNGEVQFGVLIAAKHAPTSVTGYQFGVRPLIEAKPTDAMQALLAATGIADDLPALAAPAAASAEASSDEQVEGKADTKPDTKADTKPKGKK